MGDSDGETLEGLQGNEFGQEDGERQLLTEEVQSLTAQLMSAKEEAEQLRAKQSRHNADVASERQCRREAEEKANKLLSKCRLHEQVARKLKNEKGQLAKQKVYLEQKLQRIREGMRHPAGKSSPLGIKHPAGDIGNDTQKLAAHMAETECVALKGCNRDERTAVKKRLLLKWHPDKQPSVDHAKFATLVLQEMQNSPIWKQD